LTVLIDSWAWIEYFKATSKGELSRKYIEGDEEIIVSTMNVAEIYNFLLKNMSKEADQHIEFILKASFVVPVSTEIALTAAKNKNKMNFGMADAIVLSTATANNANIVTGDADFIGLANVIFIGEGKA